MTARDHRRAASALAALIVAAIAAWIAYSVWDLGADEFFDEWLYDGVIAGCVALAAWRGLAVRDGCVAWLLIAAGLAFWLAGDVWWVIHENDDELPIPSLADWLYFAMYPPMTLAIVLLIRKRVGRLSGMLALDGFIAAGAIAALSATLVLEPVLDTASGSATATAVTIAYPVLDIVLLGLLVEAVALGGWMLSRGWALLAAGLAGFAVPMASTARRSPRTPTGRAARSTSAGSSRCCSSGSPPGSRSRASRTPRTWAGASSSRRACSPRSPSASRRTRTPRRSTCSRWRPPAPR